LEPRGSNQYAIKSCHGTYLGLKGEHPTWTNNPNNTCIWTIRTVNGQQNSNQSGFNQGNQGFNHGGKHGLNKVNNSFGFQNGDTVSIEQNGKFIGGVKDLNTDLKFADQLQPWE